VWWYWNLRPAVLAARGLLKPINTDKQESFLCANLLLKNVYTIFRMRDYHIKYLLSTYLNIVDTCNHLRLALENRVCGVSLSG
jgi:hypothetical protein